MKKLFNLWQSSEVLTKARNTVIITVKKGEILPVLNEVWYESKHIDVFEDYYLYSDLNKIKAIPCLKMEALTNIAIIADIIYLNGIEKIYNIRYVTDNPDLELVENIDYNKTLRYFLINKNNPTIAIKGGFTPIAKKGYIHIPAFVSNGTKWFEVDIKDYTNIKKILKIE